MNSGRSKIEPVRIYLNNLRRKACSTVQAGTSKRRPVFISQERVKVFVGASFTQPPGTPCIKEMKPFVMTVCAHTHTRWFEHSGAQGHKSIQDIQAPHHVLCIKCQHVIFSSRACMRRDTYTCLYTHTCTHIGHHAYTYMHESSYAHIYLSIYLPIYLSIYLSIYLCIYVCVCVYTYAHIHTHGQTCIHACMHA